MPDSHWRHSTPEQPLSRSPWRHGFCQRPAAEVLRGHAAGIPTRLRAPRERDTRTPGSAPGALPPIPCAAFRLPLPQKHRHHRSAPASQTHRKLPRLIFRLLKLSCMPTPRARICVRREVGCCTARKLKLTAPTETVLDTLHAKLLLTYINHAPCCHAAQSAADPPYLRYTAGQPRQM